MIDVIHSESERFTEMEGREFRISATQPCKYLTKTYIFPK